MTEPEALPPQEPAQVRPLEARGDSQAWPSERSLEDQPSALEPPSPPPLAPAMMVAMVAPEVPQVPQPERPPLPPPYSPPPPRPEPAPFEPRPPVTPPQPPGSPPFSGGAQPLPAAAAAPRGSGWPVMAHLTSLFDFGFSFLGVGLIGPLIIWLVKKDEDAEADWHGRESLNFQLNLLILWIVALPLYCLCGFGLLIHFLLPFYKIILVVIASIRAADGKRFRYPYTLRLLNA